MPHPEKVPEREFNRTSYDGSHDRLYAVLGLSEKLVGSRKCISQGYGKADVRQDQV